ncbi:MAG TPA: 2-oxoglutarate and iron-dependent oxygenase domain-containing protein [Stellaceae bacterium]|nr:2-oxoglutarate and iron-dependent oxygenase domain-containing protein [Stellaceae bacterium]
MVETIKDDEVGLYADFDNRARRAALATQQRSARTLPIIDFAAYAQNGGLVERTRVARALRAACIDTGFFYLANHGITQAELDVAHAWGLMFFQQPRAEKAKLDKSKHMDGGVLRLGRCLRAFRHGVPRRRQSDRRAAIDANEREMRRAVDLDREAEQLAVEGDRGKG